MHKKLFRKCESLAISYNSFYYVVDKCETVFVLNISVFFGITVLSVKEYANLIEIQWFTKHYKGG